MSYKGIVKNGVVVLEPPADLPEGTSVRIEPEPAPVVRDDDLDPAWRMDELAGPTGIPDLAVNVDHYLYGHSKVTDGK
ncbi:MAG: hypothetical protein IH623_08315 [Verrucomicrobia bacterium]|nr:hypothetical protein [Verrucomicrobiota bacterium]